MSHWYSVLRRVKEIYQKVLSENVRDNRRTVVCKCNGVCEKWEVDGLIDRVYGPMFLFFLVVPKDMCTTLCDIMSDIGRGGH